MQLTDPGLTAANQPRKKPPRAWPSLYRHSDQRPPRSMWGVLGVLLRLDATPAFAVPPLVGAVLGWWQTGEFSWGILLVLTLGTLTTVWGSATLNEYFDYRRSIFTNGHTISEPFASGLSLIHNGHLRPRVAVNLGLILFVLSGVCALWLGLLGGWPVLFFFGLGLIIALGAAAAPLLKITYLAWTFVEICRYVAFGFLPLLAGYYSQAPNLYLLPMSVGVGFACFIAALLFAQRIIHRRRDWLLQKRTMSVLLGPARSMDVCVVFTVTGYVALLMGASLTALPLWTLITLLALPVPLRRFAGIRREEISVSDSMLLYEAVIGATVFSGILFMLALIIDKWV